MDALPFRPHEPLLGDLYRLWQAKRRDARIPARSEFSLDELRPLMGRLAILDVIDGGADFRFRLYGSNLANAYRGEMTGKSVREYRPNFYATIAPGYLRCVTTRAPHYDRLEVDDRLMLFRWERLILPLASDGTTVNMLLVASITLEYHDKSGA